jgi:hypothetical protein
LGFGQRQALDLIGWRGNQRDPRFRDVLAAVRAMIDGGPIPQPRAPRARARRRVFGGIAVVLTAALFGFVFNLFGAQNAICRGPVRDVCGIVSIGGVPSADDEAAFEQAKSQGCDGLRAFIASGRGGVLQFEADRLLSARRTEPVTTWVETERTLPLFEPTPERGHATESSALEAVTTQARESARKLCAGLAQSGMFRGVSTSLLIDVSDCRSGAEGWRCSFEGTAVCALETRETRQVEVCKGSES